MNTAHGMSLIDLTLTLALVAILSGFASHAYHGYLIRAHQAAAMALLVQNANALTRYYAQHGSYKADSRHWPPLLYTRSPERGEALFSIRFKSTAHNTDEGHFLLRAEPLDKKTAGDTAIEVDQDLVVRHCQPAGSAEKCLIR